MAKNAKEPVSPEQARLERHRMMTEDPLSKVVPTIAVPMIISMLVESIYNIADTYFVSQLGMSATAAVGINDSLMHIMMSLAMGFGMGASSSISRLLGAKNHEEASRTGTTALFTAMGVGIVFSIIAYCFLDPFILVLGATESSKVYAMDYATYILLAAPFTCANQVLSSLLRSDGSTRLAAVGQGIGCVINCILDPIFIMGLRLGVAGAAIATGLSKVISFVVLAWPFIRKKSIVEVKWSYFTPRWRIYREIARMGIPSFLRSSLLTVSSVIINNLAGNYGDHVLAAISVGNKCHRFVASAVLGFGMGFQPVAGYCYGAKRYRRVFEAFWYSLKLGCGVAIVVGGALVIFSRQLVGVFTTNEATDVIELGSWMIRVLSYTLPFHLFVMLAGGIYQALGRAVGSTILNLSRQLIFLIPSVFICNALFHEVGLASAQAVSDAASMLAGVPMFILIYRSVMKEEKDYIASLPEDQREAALAYAEGRK